MELRIDSRVITSYRSLMKTINSALKANWGGLNFTSTSPRVTDVQSLNTPIIAYHLGSKTPGDLVSVKEIKPRIRETIVVPKSTIRSIDEVTGEKTSIDIKGGAMEVWGQLFDYVIDFNIYGANNDEADDAADKFQQFMFKYTGYLKELGVAEILFLNMYSNQDEQTKANLACRTASYLFRLDEIVGVKVPAIETIGVEASIIEEDIKRLVVLYGLWENYKEEVYGAENE